MLPRAMVGDRAGIVSSMCDGSAAAALLLGAGAAAADDASVAEPVTPAAVESSVGGCQLARPATPSASSARTATGVPTATSRAPSATRYLAMKPSSCASHSIVALSVSTSARIWPGATCSPGALRHFVMLPYGGGRRPPVASHPPCCRAMLSTALRPYLSALVSWWVRARACTGRCAAGLRGVASAGQQGSVRLDVRTTVTTTPADPTLTGCEAAGRPDRVGGVIAGQAAGQAAGRPEASESTALGRLTPRSRLLCSACQLTWARRRPSRTIAGRAPAAARAAHCCPSC
jgi:hypothetical protein